MFGHAIIPDHDDRRATARGAVRQDPPGWPGSPRARGPRDPHGRPLRGQCPAVARDAQGILFRGKPMCSERLMAACAKLKVVGRHGAGLDIVDLPAATRLGVAVVHAPGSNSNSVAEHAIMLMLLCAKHAVEVDKRTRAANWCARDGGSYRDERQDARHHRHRQCRAGGWPSSPAPSACASSPTTSTCPTTRCAAAAPSRWRASALLRQADVVTCHTPHTERDAPHDQRRRRSGR